MDNSTKKRKVIKMKALAFGTVNLPDMLPTGFLEENPLPAGFLTWTYCNNCGEVIPGSMKLVVMLCEMIRRSGTGQECDPLMINWNENYILSRGCSTCDEDMKGLSIERYQ